MIAPHTYALVLGKESLLSEKRAAHLDPILSCHKSTFATKSPGLADPRENLVFITAGSSLNVEAESRHQDFSFVVDGYVHDAAQSAHLYTYLRLRHYMIWPRRLVVQTLQWMTDQEFDDLKINAMTDAEFKIHAGSAGECTCRSRYDDAQ